MRLQLALNVRDLEEAVSYYSKLFGAAPHKRRPGYANFALASPPLKLVLFENPDAAERLNHLGVEVLEPNALEHAEQRLQQAGVLDEIRRDEVCCHAAQDKFYSQEPQGLRWEWYRITDDNPVEQPMPMPEPEADTTVCCDPVADNTTAKTCCA